MKIPNVFEKELRLGEISLESSPGFLIKIDPCQDFDAGLSKTRTSSTAATKEINRLDHL